MSEINRERQCNIEDVAALAGVSTATVSRVLNESARVSSKTAERVSKAVAALGYVPSAAARILAGGRTNTLGLLVPEISGDFFVPMLKGIERAAGRLGYDLLIRTTAYRRGNSVKRILGDQNTDGLLLFTDSADDETIRAIETTGHPAVLLYREVPSGSVMPSVLIENEAGAFTAVSHLIEVHGLRRIVFAAGPKGNHDGRQRERGYLSALVSHGIKPDPRLVIHGDFSKEAAMISMEAFLKAGIPFDGVFAADDGSAIGILAALRTAGISVPGEAAVMGFDDVTASAHTLPSLSTVQAPTELVGTTAVSILHRLIGGETVRDTLVLPTKLVLRGSCGCGSDEPIMIV